MSPNKASEIFQLYPETPMLDSGELIDRFAAWSAGAAVASEVLEVGRISLHKEGKTLLAHPCMAARQYSEVTAQDPLFMATLPLRRALQQFAKTDMARADLTGSVRARIVAGTYEYARDADPLHADNFNRQQVRWTVAHGIGGTVGATGKICKSDLVDADRDGTLLPKAASKFRLSPSAAGAVMRFSVSDVHAGCTESGPRILAIATWRLPRPL